MDDDTLPYQNELAKRLMARAAQLREAGASDSGSFDDEESREDPEAARRNED